VKPEARTKCTGEVPFIATIAWGQHGPVQGEREVMARRGGRASVLARVARRSSDVAVAAALRGGHTEGVCPYTNGEEVSWTICRIVADAVCNIPTSNPYNHVLGMV
jgi:hypothetical protein